jgi:hypothetical protein
MTRSDRSGPSLPGEVRIEAAALSTLGMAR